MADCISLAYSLVPSKKFLMSSVNGCPSAKILFATVEGKSTTTSFALFFNFFMSSFYEAYHAVMNKKTFLLLKNNYNLKI